MVRLANWLKVENTHGTINTLQLINLDTGVRYRTPKVVQPEAHKCHISSGEEGSAS